MLVYREWTVRSMGSMVINQWRGWYLFGVIPLVKKCVQVKGSYHG